MNSSHAEQTIRPEKMKSSHAD